jgi:hypothetical protein
LGSRALQCRERYHAPIGRSVTDFMVVRRRKGSLFLLRCVRLLLADCVAKVECCRSINFSRKHKREAIADSYNLYRVTEVACEFNVRRWEPSHLYTKTAPVARRIFDHQCKTTFATQSARNGRADWSRSCPVLGVLRPRLCCDGAAVPDPERHFVTVNYCIAKGLFDHPVRWRAQPSRRFEASSISISQRPSQPN